MIKFCRQECRSPAANNSWRSSFSHVKKLRRKRCKEKINKMKKVLFNILKISVTLVILYLIYGQYIKDPEESKRIVQSFQHAPWWFAVSFMMQLGAVLFSILRWRVLLISQELNVPFAHVVKTFLVGRFLGTFTPTGVGLEAYKAYDIARYTGKAEASVSVVLIEKFVSTFFSLSLLVLCTLPFFAQTIDPRFLYVFGVFFAVLLIFALILLFRPELLRKVLLWRFPLKTKIEKPLIRTVDAFTIYRHKRGSLLLSVFLGLVVYFFWFLTYYSNSLALGAQVGFVDVFKVTPMTQIASMIPLSIAGIGLREGAFTGLFASLGVIGSIDAPEALPIKLSASAALLISYAVNVFGAVLFLTRKTDYQRQMAEMKMAGRQG